jgi:hypothetical protein
MKYTNIDVKERKTIFYHLSHIYKSIFDHMLCLNQHIFQLTYNVVVLVTFDASSLFIYHAVIIFRKHKNQSYYFTLCERFFQQPCNISICSAHLSSIVYSLSLLGKCAVESIHKRKIIKKELEIMLVH